MAKKKKVQAPKPAVTPATPEAGNKNTVNAKDKNAPKKPMTLKEKVIDNVKVFFSAYLIAFVIRLLLIEAYQIPSQSMVPNLKVGDILMVEKFTMGTVLPMVHWKIPGFTAPKRNDIIVFIAPEWKSPGFWEELVSMVSLSLINLDNTPQHPKNLVKRLVGEPGDVISMSNSILSINNVPMTLSPVGTSDQKILSNGTPIGSMYFNVHEEKLGDKKRIVQFVHSNYRIYQKLLSEFPTIRVPKKGDKIKISEQNSYYLELLGKLIARETGKKLAKTADNRLVFVEGVDFDLDESAYWLPTVSMFEKRVKEINQTSTNKIELKIVPIEEWEIKEDHYFAMGDNRDQSEDCRYFGFIPKQNIFGRILFRYFPFPRFSFNIGETKQSMKKQVLGNM